MLNNSINQKYIFYIFSFLLCLVIFNAKLNITYEMSGQPDGDLIATQMSLMEFMSDRSADSDNYSRYRKKYRWAYKYIETSLYESTASISLERAQKYIFLLHYVIIMFLSLLLSVMLFQRLANDYSMKVKLIGLATFLIPYQLVFLVTGFDETFVYIEVFSIVMALYAAVEKKKLLFVIAIILGVSNRETGVVLGLLYPIINYKNMSIREAVIFILLPPTIFVILNVDIINNIFNVLFPGSFSGRPSLLKPFDLVNYLGVGELMHSIILYCIYLAPLAYMSIQLMIRNSIVWPLYIFILYLIIVFIGSYYTNFTLLLLFIPIYIATTALFYKINHVLYG